MEDTGSSEPGAGPPAPSDDPDFRHNERLGHFIRMLSDDDAVSRWKAAEALGRMAEPQAVDELISTL